MRFNLAAHLLNFSCVCFTRNSAFVVSLTSCAVTLRITEKYTFSCLSPELKIKSAVFEQKKLDPKRKKLLLVNDLVQYKCTANAYCEICSSVMNVLQEHDAVVIYHFRHQFTTTITRFLRFGERKINQTSITDKSNGWRLSNIEPEIGPSQLTLFLGEVEHYGGGGGDTVISKMVYNNLAPASVFLSFRNHWDDILCPAWTWPNPLPEPCWGPKMALHIKIIFSKSGQLR